jgi:hypothetical protein
MRSGLNAQGGDPRLSNNASTVTRSHEPLYPVVTKIVAGLESHLRKVAAT